MTSELKSATARANGAKSTGPKTAETRAISARNSLGHGLTARNTILLQCESPEEFQQMLEEFEETYRPATPEQKNLVDEMVAARWRLDRLCLMETALLDDEMDRMRKLPGNHPDTGIQLGRAFRSLTGESGAVALIRRYQSTLHRVYAQAYRTLRELQAKAEANSPKPPVPPAPIQPEPHARPRPEPVPIRGVQNEPTAEITSGLHIPENVPIEDNQC